MVSNPEVVHSPRTNWARLRRDLLDMILVVNSVWYDYTTGFSDDLDTTSDDWDHVDSDADCHGVEPALSPWIYSGR
ncbi:hypothetical protein VHEMI10722 [[Torrubiella] hemipterigena]|uniref:Uncharacterized protein n=1 Tax=[Torrubiella] hemipterigena TaxID=1531966 RepID=A0A0A1TSQ5_9HYPO|nr:hypothetical protein VHEMI10722 [[Torrubiella] hemipterigena]